MSLSKFHTVDGLTETEIIATLEGVSGRIAKHRKYIFDGHTEDDIVQRGIYEGLKCIANGKYEASKGRGGTPADSLKRFMNVHIRRRLSNYKRDMMRKNNAGGKGGVVNPLSLMDFMVEGRESADNIDDSIHREMIARIKSGLSNTPEMLTDFYRMMDGANVSQQNKVKLRQRIVEILKDLGYGFQEED